MGKFVFGLCAFILAAQVIYVRDLVTRSSCVFWLVGVLEGVGEGQIWRNEPENCSFCVFRLQGAVTVASWVSNGSIVDVVVDIMGEVVSEAGLKGQRGFNCRVFVYRFFERWMEAERATNGPHLYFGYGKV